jgi:hypothetical protein
MIIHHRGTESTERIFVFHVAAALAAKDACFRENLFAAKAAPTYKYKEFSVSSVPLW